MFTFFDSIVKKIFVPIKNNSTMIPRVTLNENILLSTTHNYFKVLRAIYWLGHL